MQIKEVSLSAILRYVKSTDSLETAKQALLTDSISALIVIDDTADIVGIITERDLLKVSHLEHSLVCVSDICSRNLHFISEDDSIEQASVMMLNNHCHHLLITDSESKSLKGILSSLDIVSAHLN